ncbi:MAG: chemotaxis protein CheB [Halioglobus sp.]
MAAIGIHFTGTTVHSVTAALSRAGHDVHVAADKLRVQSMLDREVVDAWIVDASAESVLSQLLLTDSYVLPADNIPNISDGQQFNVWIESVLRQLEMALLRPPVIASIANRRHWQEVQAVWLLAGSAGATAAVAQFLNAFTEQPPVAFLYAQHLDPQLHHQLERFTLSSDLFSLCVSQGSHSLQRGSVVMISPSHTVALHETGRITSNSEPWAADHTPDINELLILLSAMRVARRGVIVFSGMGDDGREALPTFDASGGSIWAQSPDSAMSAAMPSAAIATGLVERIGAPAELAAAFSARYPSF